jgi:hypothetical protein
MNFAERHRTAIENAEPAIERLKKNVDATVARIQSEIPAEHVDRIMNAAHETLCASLAADITANDFKAAYGRLDKFVADVRAAVVYERAHGVLRQVTPFDELNNWKGELSANQWRAAECSTMIDAPLLKAGDRIAAINFNCITLTDGRLITRDMVRANCRHEIFKNLVSMEKLAEIQSAPPKRSIGNGTGIVDERGHYQPFGA